MLSVHSGYSDEDEETSNSSDGRKRSRTQVDTPRPLGFCNYDFLPLSCAPLPAYFPFPTVLLLFYIASCSSSCPSLAGSHIPPFTGILLHIFSPLRVRSLTATWPLPSAPPSAPALSCHSRKSPLRQPSTWTTRCQSLSLSSASIQTDSSKTRTTGFLTIRYSDI